MQNQKLKQEQKVFFIGEKLPMTVAKVNKNYAIVTRPIHRRHDADILKHKVEMGGYCTFTEAFEDLKYSLIYSILDFNNNVKGPHNSFGYGIEKETLKKDASDIMKALESNEIEISRRNSCELNIDFERTFGK